MNEAFHERASVEVLVPHWNQADLLERALRALSAQTYKTAVCVIDNGSTDHTSSVLGAFPHVRCIELGRNFGFGAAVNRGIASSDARLIVLLNNDAVADARFIEELVETQARSGAEMVAGCLREPAGRVESMGVEIDTSLVTYDYMNGSPYADLPSDLPPPLGPCGGAAAYLRDAIQSVGCFDEAIFAYLEDVDLAIRMRLAGMSCAVAPSAFVFHEHSATLGQRSTAKNELVGWSGRYLYWKYGEMLDARGRARRLTLDGVTICGKVAFDRDLGMLRGWIRAGRDVRRATPLTLSQAEIARVPRSSMTLTDAFRARLARRRVARQPAR